MDLLIDVGNTKTQFGLANEKRVLRGVKVETASLFQEATTVLLRKFTGRTAVHRALMCSVVPRMTEGARHLVKALWNLETTVLTHRNVALIGVDYPRPASIGPDRLANSIAAYHRHGGPVVVVDFGTAVTFDVVDARGRYIGGVIAPGLASMADYLHEKTALLPRIKLRETSAVIGKSTREAMLIGAIHGYRGLIRELIQELKKELGKRRLPIIATGGCARLIASKIESITEVDENLTLEGLRLFGEARQAAGQTDSLPSKRSRRA